MSEEHNIKDLPQQNEITDENLNQVVGGISVSPIQPIKAQPTPSPTPTPTTQHQTIDSNGDVVYDT